MGERGLFIASVLGSRTHEVVSGVPGGSYQGQLSGGGGLPGDSRPLALFELEGFVKGADGVLDLLLVDETGDADLAGGDELDVDAGLE